MITVVLDTNIIVASLSTRSKYRIIIDKLLEGTFSMTTSTDILLEYEEKIARFYNGDAAANFIDALILLPNVIQKEPLFKSALISDSDDNKFLEAYYSAKANILVTNDKHFQILKSIEYPPHHIMDIQEFIEWLNKLPPDAGEVNYALAV